MIHSIIWLPATLLAGLLQAWRTAVQQRLRTMISVSGAGLVRYLYGLPIGIVLLMAYMSWRHVSLPAGSFIFFIDAAVAAIAQILATILLIAAFGHRNFVVGTAFAKTEVVQVALFAWLVLGEHLSLWVMLAIGCGITGVLILTLWGQALQSQSILKVFISPAARCGLGAGTLFAITSVFVKRATHDLNVNDPTFAALISLVVVMFIQTVVHCAWLAVRDPETLKRAINTWRVSLQVGVLASLGSACWFIGFANAPVALVRVVGQIEVVFTLLFAHWYLREKTSVHESFALILIVAGVVLALIGSL
ncbi:MAG TPA: DMT family transporter [Steroidobacteraceae bacterium]|nr:DMT family transporter [Steroidobacteraceae bacterium]